MEDIVVSQNRAIEGGGIYNNGTITFTNGAVVSNSMHCVPGPACLAAGIANKGFILVQDSLLSGNISPLAGAILNTGEAMILNSTLNGNDARHGGGVYNEGVMTISTSQIISNTSSQGAAGIANFGTVTVTHTTISGNQGNINTSSYLYRGGGIYNDYIGSILIEYCTITNNSGVSGGGISTGGGHSGDDVPGKLIIRNSTIRGNSAYDLPGGGGIWSDQGVFTITNSTISGNSSSKWGGGLSIYESEAFLNNVTISNNTANSEDNGSADPAGGGIRAFGTTTVTLQNSILAGNFDLSIATRHPDCSSVPGILISNGHNLIGKEDGCNWVVAIGDLTGTIAAPLDPQLGSLVDNGGHTLTHALLQDSPAIDVGNPASPGSGGNACEIVDQRDVARPQGDNCDIGAYELDIPMVYLPMIMK
jgi:hypothetical protein